MAIARNVGELKKLIENLPDGTPLVVSAFDHSYRMVKAVEVSAIYDRSLRSLSEDFDPEPEDELYCKRIKVLLME